MAIQSKYIILVGLALLVLLPKHVHCFGAGNIASISKIEGRNWRHGDIEDMLATVACLKGHKWKSSMIKRVYFGNWLRDYSQVTESIRILVWILSFMSFGYATGEFEVTSERLGTYRPEEHIGMLIYNVDARKFDQRLRGPVTDDELAVDPQTGMKNYIANERGPWATSAGYVKFSFSRAIHFGRMYTHGPSGQRGDSANLAEALRCLGQGLHCLEDFGAHTNYVELVLREIGFNNVFPHTGVQTQINLHGKHVYPLVTGTFGGVDFFHSVLGEATDHFTQSEVDEMNTALSDALTSNTNTNTKGGGSNPCSSLCDALGKVPGAGGLIQEAQQLQAASDAQAAANAQSGYRGGGDYSSSRAGPTQGQQQQPMTFDAPPGSEGGPPGPNIPGTNMDPATVVRRIYPILEFRDKVVRSISSIIEKVPGLEKLIETITERVTLFVLSLLAPFIMPIIQAVSKQLKVGSSSVVEAAAKHQFEPWTNPQCTDPTHSLLSKDHFSNILNEPAGLVAAEILKFCAPRVIYAMDHPDVPVDQVLNDCIQVFHHPAIRNTHIEVHRTMFEVVKKWVDGRQDRGRNLDSILSSDSVRNGKNHSGHNDHSHGASGHGAPGIGTFGGGQSQSHSGGGGHSTGSHSGGPGGFLGSLTSNLPGHSGGGFNLLSRPREGPDGRPMSSGSFDGRSHSPQPGSDFQPYQSAYAGGGATEPYNAAPPPGGQYGGGGDWGHGQYTGGAGAEPSYTVPTAYQQGYENYGGGYQQPPPQQGGYGTDAYGGGYDQSQQQQQQGGGGRQWGSGGGNNVW
ncbi:Het-C-domain-containing protein [Polyplosphaeria fusca]|uniref:Het-C-domain-containing protein n=1 Tax=Polyplosphaeria fusca TaxID=682080 RepID=A0A9P4R2T5_9PLEO|nr:Het-C-domain-containing protein [Polyplosphaeria fusca]